MPEYFFIAGMATTAAALLFIFIVFKITEFNEEAKYQRKIADYAGKINRKIS